MIAKLCNTNRIGSMLDKKVCYKALFKKRAGKHRKQNGRRHGAVIECGDQCLVLHSLQLQATHRHSLLCQPRLHSHSPWPQPGGAPDLQCRPQVSSLGFSLSSSPLALLLPWSHCHQQIQSSRNTLNYCKLIQDTEIRGYLPQNT